MRQTPRCTRRGARRTVDQLQTQHGQRFVLAGPESLRGYFAADALRRAIENLATNAVKYGAASRPITIALRELHGWALMTVNNEGSYIPVEEQETLFRAFHRLRSAEEGAKRGWGLGLAQVRGVAEAHGGSITIDSLPGRGTTFIIDVPLDARRVSVGSGHPLSSASAACPRTRTEAGAR